MRAAAFVVFLLLALPALLVPHPAAATSPLVADAGLTQVALDGASVAMPGAAAGGVAPYSYRWDDGLGATRFSDPKDPRATWTSAGLAPQNVTMTLTVTDANGAVASDAVAYRVDVHRTLASVNLSFAEGGVPDEAVGQSLDGRSTPFTVKPGTTAITATLSWADSTGLDDIDLELIDPNGNSADPGQGHTTSNPETVTIQSPMAGRWLAKAEPYTSAPTTGHLTVVAPASLSVPEITFPVQPVFGRLDPQTMHGAAAGGTGAYEFRWDLDRDGVHETAGATATASLAPGTTQVVDVTVTDAAGFRADRPLGVSVHAADHVLQLVCGGRPDLPHWAMEFSASHGTCWMHEGHHTYYFDGAAYALASLDGFGFAVEEQFAPSADAANPSLASPVTVEVSLDGRSWTTVDTAAYRMAPANAGEAPFPERQVVQFHAVTRDAPAFRFLRVHTAPSLTQGLTGYLDHTQIDVDANDVSLPPAAPAAGTSELSCARGDILEDFVAAHPCTFGGQDRYDAASFFQTYYLGQGSSLASVGGSFVLAPFRQDDFAQASNGAANLQTYAFVQTSVDGVAWTDVATVPATYGVPASFHLDLGGQPATFVRLFPQYHPSFDDYLANAPLHHARGYFVASNLTVTASS